MPTVVSYGGGIQSTALVVLAMRECWAIDEIVHVDLVDADRRSRGKDEIVVLRVDMSAEQDDFCEAGFCDV